MARHWAWLLLSLGVIVFSLARVTHTMITGEWDIITVVLGPLTALIWAPTANEHHEAIWKHVDQTRARNRGDDSE